MRRLIIFGLALGLPMSAATCGQKGPLELPERDVNVTSAEISTAALRS